MSLINKGCSSLQAIVTTSWDDGHPLDLRIAEMLKKYGLKGTFYIPVRNDEHPVMNKKEILNIASGFEIGGHTVNHLDLTTIPGNKVYPEIAEGKKIMEDVIGREMVIFAYPKGHYNKQIIEQVRASGFRGARSASWFHRGYSGDLYRIHPTIHIYPHKFIVHIGHLVKEWNIRAMKDYLVFDRCSTDLKSLTERWLYRTIHEGGIFHIWGHSWEIEKMGLWGELEWIARYISKIDNIMHLTNGETISFLENSRQL